jgi:predicted glycoside hydrolase/deacetylase ChbG (UPF0249 family)
MRRQVLAFVLVALATTSTAQTRTLAERLGHPPGTKLVMIHADDLGMSHGVNQASTEALSEGAVHSASIMVPTPWFPEIAAWARENPSADLGLHLTLTSEWTPLRWRPILAASHVPSLLDADGYLHKTEDLAAAAMKPHEAEIEVRAQIERARAAGIRFTHFDSHMRTLLKTPQLLDVFLRVGREYKIPVGVWREIADDPEFRTVFREGDVVLDQVETIGPEVRPEQWADWYEEVIRNLKPGVTEIVVHCAYDHPDLRAATADHLDWGSAWRQRDFDALRSERVRRALRESGAKVVTWREIGRLME